MRRYQLLQGVHAIHFAELAAARFTATNRRSAKRVQTVNWVTSLVAQLKNIGELKFYSWMDETSLPEIPEWITSASFQSSPFWPSKSDRLKPHLPNWPLQLWPGESSAGSLPRPIRPTESRAAYVFLRCVSQLDLWA